MPLAEVVEAVESDIALVVAVMRVANDSTARARRRVENVVDAVRILTPEAVQQLAERVRTFDFFERSAVWDSRPTASACTRSPPSAPPSCSPARSATPTATA